MRDILSCSRPLWDVARYCKLSLAFYDILNLIAVGSCFSGWPVIAINRTRFAPAELKTAISTILSHCRTAQCQTWSTVHTGRKFVPRTSRCPWLPNVLPSIHLFETKSIVSWCFGVSPHWWATKQLVLLTLWRVIKNWIERKGKRDQTPVKSNFFRDNINKQTWNNFHDFENYFF